MASYAPQSPYRQAPYRQRSPRRSQLAGLVRRPGNYSQQPSGTPTKGEHPHLYRELYALRALANPDQNAYVGANVKPYLKRFGNLSADQVDARKQQLHQLLQAQWGGKSNPYNQPNVPGVGPITPPGSPRPSLSRLLQQRRQQPRGGRPPRRIY